mgnify:CR=1 FL=1
MDLETCLKKLQYIGVLALRRSIWKEPDRSAISVRSIMRRTLSIFYRQRKRILPRTVGGRAGVDPWVQ